MKEDNLYNALTNEEEFGKIIIKVKDLLEDRKISKTKLSFKAEIQRSQVIKYCNQSITRIDIAVLARLCHALNCKIEDILEYIPPEKIENYRNNIK